MANVRVDLRVDFFQVHAPMTFLHNQLDLIRNYCSHGLYEEKNKKYSRDDRPLPAWREIILKCGVDFWFPVKPAKDVSTV